MLRFLLFCVFALCVPSVDVRAASLSGRVIDVSSGDVITVFNLNRAVRVKLLGVDAPEMDQAFGDVAKKHLSGLVYDKSVVVEYSGIAADGSVAGRVLLNDADIGAQMIRDGAAWFDPNNLSRLSATDREIYQQSEQAARNERRGLWQAEHPMAPWEFVKARALRVAPRASVEAVAPAPKNKVDRPSAELTNLTLMTRGTTAAAPTSPMVSTNEADFAWAAAVPRKAAWQEFRPAGEDFTALVPENGKQLDTEVPLAGEMVGVNLYMARDGLNTYFVQWLKAPSFGESDRAALSDAVMGFSMGLKEGLGSYANSSCGPKNEKFISVGGHTGIEFEMSSCPLGGRGRIVTKIVNGYRQMYVLAALYMDEDDNVPRFLNSLTLDATPKKQLPRKGTKSTHQ